MKLYILIAVWLIAVTGCATSPRSNPRSGAASPVDAISPGRTDSDASESEFDMLEEEYSGRAVSIADPIESWNRLMHNTNDGLYFWVLKPVAQGYKAVVPEPGRVGIRNFFNNLATPVRFVNCLLQGKFHSAGNEINRCVINTTWGVLGVFDPALEHGRIEPANEDMGQTLAVYGFDNGFYVVWPLFGPSTLRDSAGRGGDYFLNPVYYVKSTDAKIGISAVNVTNKTSFHIGEYEEFKAAAVDPYIAMREAYIQYRQKQIQK